MNLSILLCQEIHCWGLLGPRVEAAVEDVGEVALEGPAGLSGSLAFSDLAGEIGLGLGVVALLDDGDPVERGVELSVAAAVQTVAIGCLAGAAGNRCGSAEASEGGGVAETSDVSGLRDDRGSEIAAGAVEVGERVLVLDQQLGDLAVKIGDPRIEVLDVPGELADATRRGASGKACAELQPSELS
jgi:hypothetical protein